MSDLTPDQRFARCLDIILQWEGGFSDNPSDPGGATMHGVTLEVFREFYGASQTVAALKAISRAQLDHIYRARFWNPIGDMLQSGLDLMYFNAAVNNGPGRAKPWVDAAQGSSADVVAQIKHFSATQEGFYRSLHMFGKFGGGWLRRLNAITMLAVSWAQKSGH